MHAAFRPSLALSGALLGMIVTFAGCQKTSVTPEEKPPETPVVVDSEAVFFDNVRQLTFGGRRSGEGYFSADGKRMVFQSEREPGNPFYQIYVLDLETGQTSRVSPGTGKTTCAWIHPKEDLVLFASTQDDPEAKQKQKKEIEFRQSGKQRRYSWDYDTNYEIYQVPQNGGEYVQLTDAKGYDAEGSWSPDGKWIAFASNRRAYSEPLSEDQAARLAKDPSYFIDIYIMRADGSDVKRLTNTVGYDGGPFFSPDGRRITWRRFNEDGTQAEIWTMNIDGSDQKQLTELEAMSWAPYYHPSGDYLIFATNLQGFSNFELYLVRADARSAVVRVTNTDGFDGLPVFTPDGHRLAWTSNRFGNQSQIFMAEWDDAAAREALGLADWKFPKDAPAPARPVVSEYKLRQHVAYLASPRLEGRLTGTPGAKLATQYVADQFTELGLRPAGEDDTYFQLFPFTAGVDLGGKNSFAATVAGKSTSATLNEQWRPLVFSASEEATSDKVVFAGYGIVAPKGEDDSDDKGAYDSYFHMDVTDAWVVVLRYMPDDLTPNRRRHLSRFSLLRHKALAARERGAKGLVVISGPHSNAKEELVPLATDASLATAGIPAVSVADAVATPWFEAAGKNLGDIQKELDTGKQVQGFDLSVEELSVTVDLVERKGTGRNVIARLPGADGTAPAVMIGAHVDHLGHGDGGNSLAKGDSANDVHHGADDNASGVAAMIEIARYIAESGISPKRDILFAAWSGEELGVLGSSHYAKHLVPESERGKGKPGLRDYIGAYINMDMIGRKEPNQPLALQGWGSSSAWAPYAERGVSLSELSILPIRDSYLPTDATSFYVRGVPILSAFTGAHRQYHTPADTPEKLHYDAMASIATFLTYVSGALAAADTLPDYQEMEKPKKKSSRGFRVYLGTVPDYTQDSGTEGVSLSGVTKGGPADKAGLRGGDVIISLAGQAVKNIYDYVYALEGLKVGQGVKVTVRRAGRKVDLNLVPGSRD